jgi:hypothetical protein
MAIPNALNRDPFVGTGVMDAPDPVVRSAMAKLMNPQGLPPMSQKELDRLLNRQYLEQENVRQAMTTSKQTMAAREAIASGQMPPIDVTSYAGSMFAAPGSYTEARPLPTPTTGFSAERSADRMLKALYGEMLPGQQVRVAGVPDEQMVTGAPQARGIEGTADALLKARFGEMQPGQQVRIAGISDSMLTPAQPEGQQVQTVMPTGEQAPQYNMPFAGQPSTQPSVQPSMQPARRPSLGPALDQLIPPQAMPQIPSLAPQAPSYMTVGQAFASTPQALARSMQEQEYRQKQAEAMEKRNLSIAASSFAMNQPLPQGLALSQDKLNQAFIEGMKMREQGIVKTREDRVVDGKVVPYEVTTNLLTRERTESQIREPFLSAEDQAKLESKKVFINLGAENIKALNADVKNAQAQAELADQLKYGIQQGATTGVFAEVSATVKNFAESVTDKEFGAAVQRLYVQGVKGMTALQVRSLMKGLGSMSNDDRKAAEAAFINIKDPKQAVLYFAELASLNYDRLLKQQNRVNEMRRSGATADMIDMELQDMKNNEPFLSKIALKTVGLDKAVPAQPAQPTQAAGQRPVYPVEAIRAEKARRQGLK